ncbi:hypothetical protein LX97_02992 [Nonlabens dokdonensis]|uniref:Uncharacterized protein n=2 Tax=Nonlabens dokdonensis TaxID=328515 RepID=L7WD81_NONDD|nr:hypothetical protein [Nonlabens dokdonensis]AGC78212.1 hypothetical protein DDD_3085 [Nonlabens dokdonensis DSW-6]PZX37897.1 hypothetical protein LX97_02992 [Nonlabens dokdonensis]
MIANKETRASFQSRLIYSIAISGGFTLFFESLDYFFVDEPFQIWVAITSFILFAIALLIMSYYFMTKKVKR